MPALTDVLVFLLGMALCVQIIAALYGFIDISHTSETAFSAVYLRLLTWVGIVALIGWMLPVGRRVSFLWGALAYGLLYFCIYGAYQLLFARNTKPLKMKSRRFRA